VLGPASDCGIAMGFSSTGHFIRAPQRRITPRIRAAVSDGQLPALVCSKIGLPRGFERARLAAQVM